MFGASDLSSLTAIIPPPTRMDRPEGRMRANAFARLQLSLRRRPAVAVAGVALVLGLAALMRQGGGDHRRMMLLGDGSHSGSSAQEGCYAYVKPIPMVEHRDRIGAMLEKEEGMFSGLELGVQHGVFAASTLTSWKKAKKYIVVDLWGQQKNYEDLVNVSNEEQEEIYQTARANLAPFEKRGTTVQFMRMLTSDAARRIPDGSLDYIYVDARHDYCGVMEDLELYWPKLREGGIFAGHDYVKESQWRESDQDWSICQDGSKHPRAVMGAVNDFAEKRDLQVVTPPFDREWRSWMIRKPATRCAS